MNLTDDAAVEARIERIDDLLVILGVTPTAARVFHEAYAERVGHMTDSDQPEGTLKGLEPGASPEYPFKEGDTTVLGPEIFASGDGAAICWRGENYVKQSPHRGWEIDVLRAELASRREGR